MQQKRLSCLNKQFSRFLFVAKVVPTSDYAQAGIAGWKSEAACFGGGEGVHASALYLQSHPDRPQGGRISPTTRALRRLEWFSLRITHRPASRAGNPKQRVLGAVRVSTRQPSISRVILIDRREEGSHRQHGLCAA